MSEPKPTCHYCGTEMEVVNAYGVERPDCFLRCKFEHCTACGPNSPNLSAAIAAHARVMPAPVWTSEPPREAGGWFWVLGARRRMVDMQHLDSAGVRLLLTHGCKVAGPLPPPSLPAEPAEGGAK